MLFHFFHKILKNGGNQIIQIWKFISEIKKIRPYLKIKRNAF